jgi:HK97 gp10 family phage protein
MHGAGLVDFSVQVEGLDQIAKATRAAQEEIDRQLNVALFASAKRVEGQAKRSILSGEKTGRVYRRRTVVHQASAPGEAPASDTGRLVNSINSYLDRSKKTALVIAGRGTALYAAMLEFGTRKMAARPFMFPALEGNRDWIRERLAAAFRKATAKSVKY